jgi:hypothetical protein
MLPVKLGSLPKHLNRFVLTAGLKQDCRRCDQRPRAQRRKGGGLRKLGERSVNAPSFEVQLRAVKYSSAITRCTGVRC